MTGKSHLQFMDNFVNFKIHIQKFPIKTTNEVSQYLPSYLIFGTQLDFFGAQQHKLCLKPVHSCTTTIQRQFESLILGIILASDFALTFANNMCSILNPNDLQRIFTKLDKNGDGLVSLEELNWVLERIGLRFRLQELESIVGKTCLDWDEFLFFYDSLCKRTEMVEAEETEEEDDLVKAFKVFDLNGDGFISSDELQMVLSRLGFWDENGGKDCRSMICEYDTNSDGVIDLEEFKNMMLHTIF